MGQVVDEGMADGLGHEVAVVGAGGIEGSATSNDSRIFSELVARSGRRRTRSGSRGRCGLFLINAGCVAGEVVGAEESAAGDHLRFERPRNAPAIKAAGPLVSDAPEGRRQVGGVEAVARRGNGRRAATRLRWRGSGGCRVPGKRSGVRAGHRPRGRRWQVDGRRHDLAERQAARRACVRCTGSRRHPGTTTDRWPRSLCRPSTIAQP